MARRRATQSDYGKQLAEKQKLKKSFSLREKQFRRYYVLAAKATDATGVALMRNLELRLDNVLYRANFFKSRKQARQAVNHGHIQINGLKVSLPSYLLKIGDEFTLATKDLQAMGEQTRPAWLEVNDTKLSGKVVRHPERDEMERDIEEELIVEFYSR